MVAEEQQYDLSFEILGYVRLHPLIFHFKEKLFISVWFVLSIFNAIACCVGFADIQFSDGMVFALKVQGFMTHIHVSKQNL